MIESVKYTSDEKLVVVLNQHQYVTVNSDNRDWKDIEQWIAEGNTISEADPEPVRPVTCSPWQIRKALNASGQRQSVEDTVAASTDIALKDGWEFATEFRSDDPFVISMGALLGMTEEETRTFIESASHL